MHDITPSPILIIGAGGVGRVVAHKCAARLDLFTHITLASRTISKCDQIAEECRTRHPVPISTAKIDADDVPALVELINRDKPALVINVALPYQDLTIMQACLETHTHYLDTANYEHPDAAHFEYAPQWAYHERFQAAGIMALLGSGFDPGVTNVFCADAEKHHFDTIDTIDIIDANAGDHGRAFATNFNPEINIREITAPGRYYADSEWHSIPALSMATDFDFPDDIGTKKIYLLYHEELESLQKHIPHIRRLRFWMTFSQSYIDHLRVLENVGMTRIDPIDFQGQKIIPLQFLKALLPEPATLGPDTQGKTCIGTLITGTCHGKQKTIYTYNICDHQAAYRETLSQAISYTTGVPAMTGAEMILTGKWHRTGVWNMEQQDPDPFLRALTTNGLPHVTVELKKNPLQE